MVGVGFQPLLGYGGTAAVLTELAFLASATSTGQTITGPATIQAGDIIVLVDEIYDSGGGDNFAPTGFTEATNAFGNVGVDVRTITSYKIANGSEASASISGMLGNSETRKVLAVFRGNIPVTTATPADPDSAGVTTGNPSPQTVTASSGTPPLIVFGIYSAEITVTVRGMTPAKTGEVASGTKLYLAYLIQNSAPANVTVDMDDNGDANVLNSFYLQAS